jgi:hypothetical protein
MHPFALQFSRGPGVIPPDFCVNATLLRLLRDVYRMLQAKEPILTLEYAFRGLLPNESEPMVNL